MSKPKLAMSLAATAAVALATVIPAAASTPSAAIGEPVNFPGVGYDYSDWSLSVYYGSFTKNYKNIPAELEFTRINAAIGYSLDRRSFATVYGVVGVMEQKVKRYKGNESASLFGLGLWLNLIESDQLSYFAGIDTYNLTAGIEGVFSKNDFGTYMSIDGFLFFEIHGQTNTRNFIFPRSVGLYAGPVFSYSASSDYDTSSSETVGIGAGLNVKFTENINLKIGGDFYSEDKSAYAQFGIVF